MVDGLRPASRRKIEAADPELTRVSLFDLNREADIASDKAVVRLALQSVDVEATVTDDRLLYVVLSRCGHQALFLPDFIEKAAVDGVYDAATGQQLLLAVRPRLQVGFVEHSLRRLEGVI